MFFAPSCYIIINYKKAYRRVFSIYEGLAALELVLIFSINTFNVTADVVPELEIINLVDKNEYPILMKFALKIYS